jgi:uncharacterized protein YprB with RNaseH-like and TPR domain
MDLKEKLRQFEPGFRPSEGPLITCLNGDIHRYVRGEEVANEYGCYFRSRTIVPVCSIHGRIPLGYFPMADPALFRLIGKDEQLEGVDVRKSLFLDTETTGLAGGTGTVPFLVGLGYFSEDQFCVEQFFMRDYNEEHAMLHGIVDRLKKCTVLISYNGKAYDLSVLRSRFILARMDPFFLDLPHLDLLFTARRLWRRRLGDCSLLNIERSILKFHRSGDISSYLIPGLYFDYLRSRDAASLKAVFQHNVWDIVSLSALAGLAGKIYQNPSDILEHPMDLFSLGNTFARMNRFQDAAVCFQGALKHPLEKDESEAVMQSLGFTLKRLGRWTEAAEVWREMIDTFTHALLPYEELAKHFEHRKRDYEKAVAVVGKGLDRIGMLEALHPEARSKTGRENLEYRLRRLKNKRLKNRNIGNKTQDV